MRQLRSSSGGRWGPCSWWQLASAAKSDCRGSVALTFALTMFVGVAVVGIAVDFGRASSVKAQMQSALDAALLNTVKDAVGGSLPDVSGTVQKAFTANLGNAEATGVQVTSLFDATAGTLTGQATGVVQARFVSLLGYASLDVTVRSKVSGKVGQGCVLALNSSASGAASMSGNASVNLKNCNLFVNSSRSDALSLGGSSSLSAYYVGVVGGISGASKITATKGVQTGTPQYLDPYATRTVPTFSGCDHTNYTATAVLNPGVYCNGLSFPSNTVVTMQPGIYFIDRGVFSAGANTIIRGTGVTIVFTSSTGANWATADIKGGADISLTAPTTGSMAGVVFFGDPRMPVGTSFKVVGGGAQTFGGAIYLPKAALSYTGNNSTSDGCTQLIADTISLTGNSKLTVECKGYGTTQIGKTSVVLVQ